MLASANNREKKRRYRSVFWKQRVMGYAFIVPALLFFCVFTVAPIGMSFWISLTNNNLLYATKFLGINNFISAFHDIDFLKSFLNVLVYAVIVIPTSVATSLLAAVLVNKKVRGVKLFRVLYYIPAVTSGVAVAFIWQWMYREQDGVFNMVLRAFRLPTSAWLDSPNYMVMFSLAIMAAWNSLGGNMLIWLAALKGVPSELYEAAEVDGANGWHKLARITLPSIGPTMYFMLTMSIIGAFQLFDPVYIMVPQTMAIVYARTPLYMIYTKGFDNALGGYATAMSLILFAVIMVVTFVTQTIFKEDKTV
jgi:multiple sugar transport system permease protein